MHYIPLRIHSPYSIAEGAVRIDELAARLQSWGIPAAAIADSNTLAGVYSVRDGLIRKGIQPITSIRMRISHPALEQGERETSDLTLIAQTEAGYHSLTKLLSDAHLESRAVRLEDLLIDAGSDEFLVLTGGQGGPIDRALISGAAERARQRLVSLSRHLGDRLYVEVQRQGRPAETEESLIRLASELDLPCAATQEVFFLDRDFVAAHDALLCIADGVTLDHADRRRADPESYLRSPEEMARLFSDLPEALQNTIEIALRCRFIVGDKAPMLPAFPTTGKNTEAEELREQAKNGLEKRFQEIGLAERGETRSGHSRDDYIKRLDFELGVIEEMGFSGYFLIVADFIGWAKQNDIPVGPGRGSGAGSLVAWVLSITDLDPLRYGLLFERFLNPARVSMPDFDIDFCQERRDDVIAYVREKYGSDRVAQIGTIGRLQARAALRDVGRVMQIPFPVIDRICKLVPNNPSAPMPLFEAVKHDPLASAVAESGDDVQQAVRTAIRIEGLFRNQSTHAAGVVIGDRPIGEIVPVYRDQHGAMVTSFDMKAVEKAGLVKFDFLGLKTLDVIKGAVEIATRAGEEVRMNEIGVDDPETYRMLCDGSSFGVFQLESAGMRRAMVQIQPSCIEDIIALVALYRPGPMANIPAYALVKSGEEAASYLHPKMEATLAETHGIIVYQEQVMELARNLAGYSLGHADMLRRAMGKKIKSEMDEQRSVFVSGAAERGIPESLASEIFDLIARFADYGFNKSHAAAYAAISFQTAYLRCHHPEAFLASSMNLDINDVEKIAEALEDARRSGVQTLPPDINASNSLFYIETKRGQRAVRHGLAAIRGVGLSVARRIVEAREQGGEFSSLRDFVSRVRANITKRVIEALINAGALDCLAANRNAMTLALPGLLSDATARLEEERRGQSSLFDILGENCSGDEKLPDVEDWSIHERLNRQFRATGFYIDGHPIELARPTLRKYQNHRLLRELLDPEAQHPREVVIGAIVMDSMFRRTRSDKPMLILKLSDETGFIEGLAFGETVDHVREVLGRGSGQALKITIGIATRDGDSPGFFVRDVELLDLERMG